MPELTLDQVRAMLACNKNRLDDELELQPDIMQRIATRVVVMTSRMMEAKDDLARVEGRLTESLKEDDPKLTVGGLEAKVKRHQDRTRAFQKFQEARHDMELWQGMLEAWKQKGFSLKTLADLYSAQYFSTNSITNSRERDRTEQQDEARAAMRRAGQRETVERQEQPATSSTPRRRLE